MRQFGFGKMNIQQFLQGIHNFNDTFLTNQWNNLHSIMEKLKETFHSLQMESIQIRTINNHLQKYFSSSLV